MLTCFRCQHDKRVSSFTERADGSHELLCASCRTEIARLKGSQGSRLPHTDKTRWCCNCRREQPNTSFTWRKNGTPFSACKDCNKYIYAAGRRARLRAAKKDGM